MFDQIFQHLVENDEDYLNVKEVIGEKTLIMFAKNAEVPQGQTRQQFVETILSVADDIYMKFEETPDLINLDSKTFGEKLKGEWDNIVNHILHEMVNRLDEGEDFPMIIDIFQVQNRITFGLEVSEKEEILENAMEQFVETEEYEMAAKVRDLLEET